MYMEVAVTCDDYYNVEGDEEMIDNHDDNLDTNQVYPPYVVDNVDDDYGYMFTIKDDRIAMSQSVTEICRTWILLDNQSTIDLISNPDLLTNIREAQECVTLRCNVGLVKVNKKGD